MAALTQKAAFADDFTALPDKPNKTAAQMKAMFDGQGGELLTYINDTQIKEITEGTYNFAASAVGTDAYAVTITNVAAMTTGLEIFILADVANTGAATCKVNALAVTAIRKNGTTVLEDGDIPAGGVAHLKYDGTYFQLLNPVKTTALSTHLADDVHIGARGIATGSTANPTTTSTSYVDLTDMSVTLTTKGGDLLVIATGSFSNSSLGEAIYTCLKLDSDSIVGAQQGNAAVADYPFDITNIWLFASVAAGSHTVKTQWEVSGGTGKAISGSRRLIVVEVGSPC